MSVRASYAIDDKQVADMDMTITMTMPVSEWRAVRAALGAKWPLWDVSRVIEEALTDLTRATSRRYAFPKEE